MRLKICSFEIAKILKALKANIGWSVFTYDVEYEGENDEIVYIEDLNIRIPFEDFKSDLRFAELALVQMWLREKFNITIEPILFLNTNRQHFRLRIVQVADIGVRAMYNKLYKDKYSSYEKTLEAGILKSIELIKTKQDG